MFKEFKEFIRKGNVIDLAIAFVMGAAFGKVATSFINDVVMPPIGLLLGKVDFSSLYINLSGQDVRIPGQGQGGGRSGHRLRDLSQRGHRVPDRGPGDLHRHPPDQQAQEQAGARVADDQGMPLLPVDRPAQGDPLPELHLRDQVIDSRNSARTDLRRSGFP